MRKTYFKCDNCSVSLNERNETFVSVRGTLGAYVPGSQRNAYNFIFATEGIAELHFCGGSCLAGWIQERINQRIAERPDIARKVSQDTLDVALDVIANP